jgi:two-component system LytT family sensor kinase
MRILNNKTLNTWQVAILIALCYDGIYFIYLNILNPAMNGWNIIEFSVLLGTTSISISSIYLCFMFTRRYVRKLSMGYQYGISLLISTPVFCLVYLGFWILVRQIIFGRPTERSWYAEQLFFQISSLHLPIASIIITAIYNFHAHKADIQLIKVQNLVTETELKNLQQQVDPHFLFNSLNILSALIRMDTERSVQFTQKLSEVYRFFLKTKKELVIPLDEELVFVKDYFYLVECRFSSAFQLQMDGLTEFFRNNYYIIPGTLQSLVENVIKHNTADDGSPIQIRIKIEEQRLFVINRINRKENTGSGYGLTNLAASYLLLNKEKVNYFEKDGHFYVSIPLIKKLPS